MQDGPYDRPPVPEDDELVGLRAAAERLGVHYMTAYRYVRIGTLPARKVDGSWQVRIGDLRSLTEQEPPKPGRGGIRWGPYRRQLRERLVAGDEAGAWSIIERALVSGAPAQDIHLELMVPVLGEIGDAWASGELDIADEHRASSVAGRLIGRLGPSFARRGRKRATVVIGAAAGDQHSMPLAILGDIIRGRGLAVVDLGANTPAESFVDAARRQDDVIAVAIGVGSDEVVEAARRTTALLHEQLPGIRVFVGGPAVTSEPEARALGADEYGATALDVATRCIELAAG
jgi:methanogenic corrinoid protein MtbC1